MKRSVILFLIILLAKISSFSQTTSTPIENDSIVTITIDELKIANLIFIEHDSLLKEKELLDKQLNNYLSKTNILQKRIELVSEQRDVFKEQVLVEQSINNQLRKDINRKNKVIKGLTIGGVSVTIGLALFLILK